MWSRSVILGLVLAVGNTGHGDAFYKTQVNEGDCSTPRNSTGSCINIKQCEELLEMLRNHNNLSGVDDYLRKSTCGYERTDPKVCCPVHTNGRVRAASNNVTLPDPAECGKSLFKGQRVVGGSPAELGAWPWMAALGYMKPTGRILYGCGGSLITERHIVTAAHCILHDLYLVRLGELDLRRDNDGASPVDILIDKFKIHEQYKRSGSINDIAILRLKDKVKYGTLIHPICLPLDPEIWKKDFAQYFLFVAGWGTVYYKGPTSSHLQQVQLPVTTQKRCKAANSRSSKHIIDDSVICAGFEAGGKDSCQGDSGGPLMWPKKGHFYLIGVVAFGFRCGEPGHPGVYTRVTAFLDWITNNLI